MRVDNLRNIAIIAHVDHGKTTMVDKLLRATDAFRANQQVEDRVLDSNDQERERGITILAKNISIEYKDVKINVIDTPGHADFGGEVERVLRMADGALLLVDAFEGPMPQTRFVLRHAIDTGLKIMIVINKIDRPGANPEKAYNDCLDLMADLGATDDQLEFAMEHVIYASGVNGFARHDPEDGNMDMYPLLDMIIDDMPAPEVDETAPLAMQCVTIDHSNFVGRIGIGRVYSGTIHQGDQILVVKNDGSSATATVKQLFTFDYLGRTECQEVGAGDIAAVVGIDRTDIGEEDLQIAGVGSGDSASDDSTNVLSWFVHRQYWVVVWGIASCIMATVLGTALGSAHLVVFPMCAMPLVLLAASRMVSFVKNYFLEYDGHDDEPKPYLGFFFQSTGMGLILSLVTYLCAQLVRTAAFPDASMFEEQLFTGCFNIAAIICLVGNMSAVIYLMVLFWRDEHDLNTSGTAMNVIAVMISCVAYCIAAVLLAMSVMG